MKIKSRVFTLVVAFVLGAAYLTNASTGAGLTLEQSSAVPTESRDTCVAAEDRLPKPDPEDKMFCRVSFCWADDLRCVNVGGSCPGGSCRYEMVSDISCESPETLPPCFSSCG